MKFISAQPNDPYFAWQIEVQINNFRKFNLSDKMHVLIFNNRLNIKYHNLWNEIVKKYDEVNFFFYNDLGCKYKEYIPAIRPHILKQHFEKFPYLEKETIFYHDSDIIFTKQPEIEELLKDNINYVSNTTSYLNSKYLKGKIKDIKNQSFNHKFEQENVVKKISEIVGIEDSEFYSNDDNLGGAQYILKNVNSDFWGAVEQNCIDIYKYLGEVNREYFSNENKGIQRWCADMWAVALNIIKNKCIIKVSKELDFCWPTDNIEKSKQVFIYHNAGVNSSDSNKFFWKGGYIDKSPFNEEHKKYVDENSCNYLYANELDELKSKECVFAKNFI